MLRTSTQTAKVRVPVTVGVPYIYADAVKMAHMKAKDAIRGDIKIADSIAWEAPSDISLLQCQNVELVKEAGPPPEAFSLLSSNLLALVNGIDNQTVPWDTLELVKKERITKHIRWLDKHIKDLPDDVLHRVGKVVSILKKMDAPDELIR